MFWFIGSINVLELKLVMWEIKTSGGIHAMTSIGSFSLLKFLFAAQVECHIYLNQGKLQEFLKSQDIVLVGYSVLGSSRDEKW